MVILLSLFVLLQDQTAPLDAPSQLRIASEDEPGQRMSVNGRVVDAETGAPVMGASVYVFHTDEAGHYSQGGQDRSRLKLSGGMRTDKEGSFRYESIRPGRYPGTDIPQHVHYVVRAGGYSVRHLELVFDDDPHVTQRMRQGSIEGEGGYDVQILEKLEGDVLHCSQIIRLKKKVTTKPRP